MEIRELEELQKRKRSQYIYLLEASELTGQLGEAIDRKDPVSIQMLLSMREDPIRKLVEIDEGVKSYLMGLSEESAVRGNELIYGAAAESTEEEPLCNEVGKYLRLLASVQELDRRLSLKIGGNRSFYRTFRERKNT